MSGVLRLFSAVWTGVDGFRKLLHLFILLLLLGVFLGAMSGTATVLPNESALTIRPIGQLVDQLEGDAYDRAVDEIMDRSNPQTLVQDVVDALNYAASDDRIEVVHLELTGLGGAGLSKLQRIGRALERYKLSGKPLIASGDFLSQGAYYLAAHADEIYLHPEGLLVMEGFGRYRTYFSDAIDKLKLDWNIFRVGTHKSFVEPYTRMDMSPEDRESTNSLIGQLWTFYADDVERVRGLDAGTIQSYADGFVTHVATAGGDPALAAVEQGLVDELLTRIELRDLMKTHAAENDNGGYRRVEMWDYLPQMRLLDSDQVQTENIGVVVASGDIVFGDQPPGVIGAESTSELLRQARYDDSVKAVVFQVDSPGGSAFASDVIANELEALQVAGKPVVVSMSSVAASGGYWISAGADRVFANASTITGSIGIFGMFPTYQRAAEVLGLGTDGVGTTRWAGQFRPDREMSDDARALFQLVIEDGYDDFISRVAEYRELDKAAVDSIAQGKVWTGRDALANGLVDELGSLEDAILSAAELAELDDFGIKRIETSLSSTEQLIVDLLSASAAVGLDPALFVREPSTLQKVAGELEDLIKPLARFNDPKGVYAHCLCELE